MTDNISVARSEATKDITISLIDKLIMADNDRQDPVKLATTAGVMYAIIYDVVSDPSNYLKKT